MARAEARRACEGCEASIRCLLGCAEGLLWEEQNTYWVDKETDLKNAVLSEISQTEKDKHYMISFIYGI